MPAPLPRGAEHRRLHRLHSLIGLALALVLLLVVFTAPVVAGEPEAPPIMFMDPLAPDFIPPTAHQPPAPPHPPAPPPPKAVDDTEVEDDIQGIALELTESVDLPAPAAPLAPVTPAAPPPPPTPPTPAIDPPIEDNVWVFVEQAPELIGGLEGLQARVEYPELARRAEIQGAVFLQFIVNERGEVVDPVVLRSPSELLSQAALAAVGESRFMPGQQRGRPVKVRYSLPVRFVLR